MSESGVSEAWLLLARARGAGLLLRILIVASPLVALACTLAAADESLPVVKFVIIAAVLACAVYPDSQTGLVVVLLIGIEWWVTVDEQTTPWSIAVAASLAVFHASMAAASVVPPSAVWTRSMRRRWVRRCATLALAGPVTWAIVVAMHDRGAVSSQVLLAVSVLSLAIAAVWARSGTLAGGRPR
jgi:hypothetical protein